MNEKLIIKKHYQKIGAMGGNANTVKQAEARSRAKAGAGRPKGAKNKGK